MKQTPNQLENKKKWRRTHPEKTRELARRSQQKHLEKLKKAIYDHYGRLCACCGETIELFLTIGHVGGWGAAHRKQLLDERGRENNVVSRGGATMMVYRDIIKRGFPDSVRIECMSCNMGAARNGGICPHVKLRQAPISTA